jgi:hypothetical protein
MVLKPDMVPPDKVDNGIMERLKMPEVARAKSP